MRLNEGVSKTNYAKRKYNGAEYAKPAPRCVMCRGPLQFMGRLTSDHYRCRDCGFWQSGDIDRRNDDALADTH